MNVGSIAGRSSLPFLGAYAASKHALEAVTDALRVELRPFGIAVTVIEPGTIATPIWRKGGETFQRLLAGLPADVLTLYGERMTAFRNVAAAAGQRGEPADEVAKVVEHALTGHVAVMTKRVHSISGRVLYADQALTRKFIKSAIDCSIERTVVIWLEIEVRPFEKVGCLTVEQEKKLLHLDGCKAGVLACSS